ncbi:sodium-dependent glucose transporter 1C-like [Brevipalpus obovatus]|uniref:sodium-dependent glucose transporter 1C-like n=1 Tax=Brevipalpus obovatus TaxID=246614 RepID=UPI003D9E7FAC
MSLLEKIKPYQYQLILTLLAYLGCGLFAFRSQSIGACLLEFEIQIQEPFSVTSRVFSAYAIGYVSGAFIFGLIEKLLDVKLVLALSCIFSGLSIAGMAFMRTFISLGCAAISLGVGNSVFDLGCHVLLINTWSEKVGNFIQILHMSYGVGSMLAPVLIRPFLLPIPEDLGKDWTTDQSFYSPEDVQIKWPFLVTCTLSIVVGFGFVYSYLKRTEKNENPEQKTEVTNDNQPKKQDEPPFIRICIAVLWVAILAHLAFSMQLVLCSFAQAFGVKHTFKMEKKSAALIASLFWGAYVIAKFVFVVLSIAIGQKVIVNICCILTGISLILILGLASQYETCLWIASGLLGLGYSPLFAYAYASLEKYFHVSGRFTSFIFLAGILGESSHTTIVGAFMDENPPFYLYYVGILGVMFLIMVIALPFVCNCLFGDSEEKKLDELASRIHSTRLSSIALPPSIRGSLIDGSSINASRRSSNI